MLSLHLLLLLLVHTKLTKAFSELQPHHYTLNRLKPFTGLPLPYTLSAHDKNLLSKGKPVVSRDWEEGHKMKDSTPSYDSKHRRGRRGRIIQDIAAPPHLCMQKILDYDNYSKMVSLLKTFEIYDHIRFSNGTDITCARFEVGVSYLRLGYYLKQKYIPQYNTLTWALDYSKDSDFDDNVGHWQVMSHPQKKNWSRVLLSTEAIFPEWLPSFSLNFIEKAALTESTGWLKREAEKAFGELKKRQSGESTIPPSGVVFTDVPHTYTEDPTSATSKSNGGDGGAAYTPHPVDGEREGGKVWREYGEPSTATALVGHSSDSFEKQPPCTQEVCENNHNCGIENGEQIEALTRDSNADASPDRLKKIPVMSTLLKKKKINKIRIRHISL